MNSRGAPPPPPSGDTWDGDRPTRWTRPADKAPAQENGEENPTWGNTEIELSSAVRMHEPSYLDSNSLDRISYVTGAGFPQAPSVLTGESAIGFQWVVAPEAFRAQ